MTNPSAIAPMDRKFMMSGIFQFLDEVGECGGPMFDYGFLIGKEELAFDESLMNNKIDLYNVLKKARKKVNCRRNNGVRDW